MSKRSVSTSKLEKLRAASGKTTKEFLQDVIDFNSMDPGEDLKDTFNKYYNHYKDTYKLSKKSSEDFNKTYIQDIFDKDLSPVKGEVDRVTASRKYGEGNYSVKVKLSENNYQNINFDMSDLGAIKINISGIELNDRIDYASVLEQQATTVGTNQEDDSEDTMDPNSIPDFTEL